ncbi:sigma-70 family RNA polymerase sigma factor [Porticoccaceae bacterium]|nr:sigma-70 family RNA polymerase sigma factor [Porticoccaceae bacterium]
MADKKHCGKKTNAKPPATQQGTGSLDMARVYTELRTSLSRFAYRYFKTPQEIEDVVQEAFVKVIEARQHRDIQHPKSYMYQTVKNLALNRISKKDYQLTDTIGDGVGESPLESVLPLTPTLEEQFESRERFELFCRAVRQLPVKCQRVYILRKVYGYSQIEIAEQMSISIKTVEAHLTKAIVRCTDYMDAEEMGVQETQPTQPGEKHSGRYHG